MSSSVRVPTDEELERLTTRAVAEIVPYQEFVDGIKSGKQLRIKMGFDPTRPVITLGWAVGMRKLRQMQDLGHTVVVIIGDWTARIGDPSGKSETRPMLTEAEVMANSQAILDQFFKVLDPERTEIRRQTEWFDKFKLDDVVRLAARVTVAQIMERDDFSQRFRANQPIGLHELYYPLLQGYDSVAIESDVEFGGTDQKFNNLVGRELQREFGLKCGPAGQGQAVFLVPLIVGLDGVKKMSQSLDNYVAINDPPNDMFGKLMSVPDHVIVTYLETLTDVPEEEIVAIGQSIEERSTNPMEHKLRMAREIVTAFHGVGAAESAQAEFRRVWSQHDLPERTLAWSQSGGDYVAFESNLTIRQPGGEPKKVIRQRKFNLAHVLHAARITSSVREAVELIQAGRVTHRRIGTQAFDTGGDGVKSVLIDDIASGDEFEVNGQKLTIREGIPPLQPIGVVTEFRMDTRNDYVQEGLHSLPHILRSAGAARSLSDATRLARQGAVQRVHPTEERLGQFARLSNGDVIRAGKRFVKVVDVGDDSSDETGGGQE